MKYFWRIVILCVLAIIIAPLSLYVSFWNKAETIVEQSGIDNRAHGYVNSPFSRAEKIIYSHVLQTSNDDVQTLVCPSFTNLLSRKSKMGTSGLLARQWLMDAEAKSIMVSQFERLFVACYLEKKYVKQVVVREYLSQAYFGAGEYGINNAALSLFSKPVEELNEKEGLALAVLVLNPQLRENPNQWENTQGRLAARIKGKK